MQEMLEEYLAFAKGDGGEEAQPTPLRQLIEEVCEQQQVLGVPIEFKQSIRRRELMVPLKRQSFKRALTNLVSNAARYSSRGRAAAARARKWVIIEVDDNGPGIPESERENVVQAVLPPR